MNEGALRPSEGEAIAVADPAVPARSQNKRRRPRAVGCILVAVLVAVLGRVTSFTLRAPSESMLPTIHVGDLLLFSRAQYWVMDPRAGDVVAFRPPSFALEPEASANLLFIKRVIGTPGQLIEIKNRQLFRDGVPINEPYLNRPIEYGYQAVDCKVIEYPAKSGQVIPIVRDAFGSTMGKSLLDELVKPEDKTAVWDYPAQKIPAGKYLMVGDNRDGSFDGRFWGLVDRRQIVGKAWVTFWPLGRFGGSDKRPG